MRYLRIILFILAILSIIATLIAYFKVRRELKNGKIVKGNNEETPKEENNEEKAEEEIPKEKIEKHVRVFTILTIVTGVLTLTAIIVSIIFKDKEIIERPNPVVGTAIIDVNPIIELKLDEYCVVNEMVALGEDPKEIVDSSLKGRELDEIIDFIRDRLGEEELIPYDDDLAIFLCTTGKIDVHQIEEKVHSSFTSKDIRILITSVEEPNEEDIKLAEEKNISACKAAYINSIIEENSDISIDYLLESDFHSLHEAKDIGRYCDKGYFLDGDMCLKELSREEPKMGKVCTEGYSEYNGKCYRDGHFEETEKETCYGDYTLKDGKCIRNESHKAEGVCEEGEYDLSSDKCHIKTYTGDATEFCTDIGRTLYEHKCLATKPTINGGCLGKDVVYKGKCVNMINDMVNSDWKCKKGRIIDPMGEIPEGGYKCYLESKVNPTSYKCNDGFTLNGKTCSLVEEHRVDKVRICETGYTLTKDGRCLDFKDSKEMTDGLACDMPNARMKDDACIIYEMIESKHSK